MIKFNRSQSNDIFAQKCTKLKKVKAPAPVSRTDSKDSGISTISSSSNCKSIASSSSFSSYIYTSSESEIMILNLRTLVEDENLEKWLEGLESKGLKHKVDTKVMRDLIKEFFEKSEQSNTSKSKSPSTSSSLESLASKDSNYNSISSSSSSEDMQMKSLKKDAEKIQKNILGKNGNQLQTPQINLNTMPHKLMIQFKELSRAKQVLVVLGITIIVASVGFLSWSLIGLIFVKMSSIPIIRSSLRSSYTGPSTSTSRPGNRPIVPQAQPGPAQPRIRKQIVKKRDVKQNNPNSTNNGSITTGPHSTLSNKQPSAATGLKTLKTYGKSAAKKKINKSSIGSLNEIICVICQDSLILSTPQDPATEKATIATKCGHLFHNSCIEEWFSTRTSEDDKLCPYCSQKVNMTADVIRIYPVQA